MPDPGTDRPDRTVVEKQLSSPLAVGRIGVLGGLTGTGCCVGPTVLALLGVVGAGTAFVWANDLYDNYKWWFRLAGVAVMAAVVWWSLRRRQMCTLRGLRDVRSRLLVIAVVAVGTYVGLYALTTWLGTFA